ncbi:hypothetical protein BG003_003245 [Podila horticola]|nr:hypothetical protein BG003_003245 [Podila horticola]
MVTGLSDLGHYDEFALYYGLGAKNSQSGPSITPYSDLNSDFRVYKVDTKSWNVFDSLTYVSDLSKAAERDTTGVTPDRHLEYSTRVAYGKHPSPRQRHDSIERFLMVPCHYGL